MHRGSGGWFGGPASKSQVRRSTAWLGGRIQRPVVGTVGGVPSDTRGGDGCCQPVTMHHGVMAPAQQRGVRQVAPATINPVSDMVGIAPMRRDPAPGERARLITQPQRLHLTRSKQPRRATPIEDLTWSAKNDRDDLRVTGQPADRLGSDHGAGLTRPDRDPRGQPLSQLRQPHRDDESGLHPDRGTSTRGGRAAAYLNERLATALPSGPTIRGTIGVGGWLGQRADRRLQDSLAFGIED